MRSTVQWRLLPAVALLFLAACTGGRKEEGAKQKQTFHPAAATLALSNKGGQQSSQGTMAVVLLPAHPTATDRLRALVQNGSASSTFTWEVNGEPVDGQNGDVLPVGIVRKGDRVTARVSSGQESVTAEATIADSPPKVEALAFQDAHVQRGQDIVLQPRATDPDGDDVSFHYRWELNGEDLLNDSPRLAGDRFSKGDRISIQVTPEDGEEKGPVFQSVPFTVPDGPPRFVTTPPNQFKSWEYSYAAQAKDPDGDGLTYALDTAPQGMTIDAHSGRVQWRIPADASGKHRIAITASDPDGMKAVQKFDLTLK